MKKSLLVLVYISAFALFSCGSEEKKAEQAEDNATDEVEMEYDTESARPEEAVPSAEGSGYVDSTGKDITVNEEGVN